MLKTRFNNYKKSAKRRGIEFGISIDLFDFVTRQRFYYCKALPNKSPNGIDRTNRRSGYTKNNIVPCCQDCNYLKGILERPSLVKNTGFKASTIINIFEVLSKTNI